MNSTIDMWMIKGNPKETVVDNIMSYKKDTMLKLAACHQVAVKKSETKTKITELLIPVMKEHFTNELGQFTPEKKERLRQIETAEEIDFSQIKDLVEKGYLFIYLNKGQLKTKLPIEWSEQVNHLMDKTSNSSTDEFTPFYRNAATFKQIYGYINVQYLVTVWNRYYEIQLNSEEAGRMLKEKNILSE